MSGVTGLMTSVVCVMCDVACYEAWCPVFAKQCRMHCKTANKSP